jgi:hypothetical protein
VDALSALFARTAELLGDAPATATGWRERMERLGSGRDEWLRVAVAGTVKSGKSTLVNALIGHDLLKRGAGIITSLVTRVRPGEALRAEMRLKGWLQVNREATDAALFLGTGDEGSTVDLRLEADRQRLRIALDGLGEESMGEGGFFDKNVALLGAYLDGYREVCDLLEDEPRSLVLGADEFERHREFAGSDALATYVDDLILEVPGLPYPGEYEIGDCQGYDSPNPRHMERVQEYLMGAHLIVYVVSSRVGLREADLRFLRDIRALGLADTTRFVLNADLTEHAAVADLGDLAQRMAGELRAVAGEVPLHVFSALRALLRTRVERGEELDRKERLLMELWQEEESEDSGGDGFAEFTAYLHRELGERRQTRLDGARDGVVHLAAAALKTQLEAGVLLAGEQFDEFAAEAEALADARRRMEASLRSFESSIQGLGSALRKDLFRRIDEVFHPNSGRLAEAVIAHARGLRPHQDALVAGDRRKLFRQMSRIYQEMRAEFHRYKVETVNPQAVDAVREVWRGVSGEMAAAASAPADLLIQNMEAYREQAASLGIEIPDHELPDLTASIGRTSIPLFSAVSFGGSDAMSQQVLGFARLWTRKLATGWARRLVGRGEGARMGFTQALLSDAADAVCELLAEEAHWNLLNYNEQLKYQVLGKSLEELGCAWIQTYQETVEALVVDLDQLAERIRKRGTERGDLIPQLREVLSALEPLLS